MTWQLNENLENMAHELAADFLISFRDRISKNEDFSLTDASLLTYAKKSCYYALIKRLKSSARNTALVELDMIVAEDPWAIDEELALHMEKMNRLRAVFDKLSERCRAVLMLFYGDSLSWKEVAEMTGLSNSNARKSGERCREKAMNFWQELQSSIVGNGQ